MACDGSGCPCKGGAAHDSRALADVGRRVLTIGTFDCLHYGHLRLLERAAQFGRLTVGVNSDSFVQLYKGSLPKYDQKTRIATLRAVGYDAVPSLSAGRALIHDMKPDILIVGSDWHENGYLDQIAVTQSALDKWGVTVMYLPRTPGVSTSE